MLGGIHKLLEDLTGPIAICIELSIDASGPEILVEGMASDDARCPRVVDAVQTLLNGPTGSFVLTLEETVRKTYKQTPEGLFAVHRIELYVDTQDLGNSTTRYYTRRVEGKMDEE